jgi:hypothetical protein
MVARTTSRGWIISHRCSWIMVYVLCFNAQVNLIVILMKFVRYLYSINCPTVICLPSMLLFILWRDTTSEVWTSVHSFTLLLPFTFYLLYLHSCKLLSFTTRNRWDWQPHRKLGQSTWLCCVQVPRCCWCKATPWTSFLAPLSGAVAKLAGIDLLKFGSFSYWFDKPWFHNWGKTCCCAHHNLLLGFPTRRLSTIFLHQHRTTTHVCQRPLAYIVSPKT